MLFPESLAKKKVRKLLSYITALRRYRNMFQTLANTTFAVRFSKVKMVDCYKESLNTIDGIFLPCRCQTYEWLGIVVEGSSKQVGTFCCVTLTYFSFLILKS